MGICIVLSQRKYCRVCSSGSHEGTYSFQYKVSRRTRIPTLSPHTSAHRYSPIELMCSNSQQPLLRYPNVHDGGITSTHCVHCKRIAVYFSCSLPHCQFHTTTTCDHYCILYAPGHRSHGRYSPSNRDKLCWCCTCIETYFTCPNRHCSFHKATKCDEQKNTAFPTLNPKKR